MKNGVFNIDRLSRLTGGGRRGAVLVGVAVVVVWLATGFYTVESNERGVTTRFGRLHARSGPGIHYALPRPIDRVFTPKTTEVKRIEVGFRSGGYLSTEPRRSDMLTGDQNILKIMMVVQYKIKDPDKYLFQTSEPNLMIERAVESEMSSYIASIGVDDVLTTAKAEIEIHAVKAAQVLLDDYGAGVTLLTGNLQVVSPPVPVIEAFNDVARAKKDSERAIEDARMYANEVIPQARGDAQTVINKALGEYEMRVNKARGEAERFNGLLREYERNRDVTKTRLYLETMERVLKTTKVVIVDDSSKVTIIEK
ncbi:MAG: FtsH protease activity modulator HflK [bacterium]